MKAVIATFDAVSIIVFWLAFYSDPLVDIKAISVG